MNVVIRGATRALTPEERSLIGLEALESAGELDDRDGHLDGEMAPHPVPIRERFRRHPEAALLTAGFYASRAPGVNELLSRLRNVQ